MINYKKAFTLIEIILVIVIAAILGSGTYVFMEQLLKKAVKAEFVTQKSLQTQAAIDQLAYMLRARVVNSTIAYDKALDYREKLVSNTLEGPILQWIGEDVDLKYSRAYSGLIDVDKEAAADKLFVKDFNLSKIDTNESYLIFAGKKDNGLIKNYRNYGWGGGSNTAVYSITATEIADDAILTMDRNVTITDDKLNYSYFYLVKSGYTVARGEQLNRSEFNCMGGVELTNPNDFEKYGIQREDFNNTMFLFYDFKPWDGETFCADGNGSDRAGKVTILLEDVTGFDVLYDDNITLSIKLNVKKDEDGVPLSKTKGVF